MYENERTPVPVPRGKEERRKKLKVTTEETGRLDILVSSQTFTWVERPILIYRDNLLTLLIFQEKLQIYVMTQGYFNVWTVLKSHRITDKPSRLRLFLLDHLFVRDMYQTHRRLMFPSIWVRSIRQLHNFQLRFDSVRISLKEPYLFAYFFWFEMQESRQYIWILPMTYLV